MKKHLLLSASFLGSVLCAQSYIIKDVDVLPMNQNQVLKNQSVQIENGKIVAISGFKKLKIKGNEQIINAKGQFLMPSLADMHMHLKSENKVEQQFLANLAAGVGHIRVMDSEANQEQVMQNRQKKIYAYSPNVLFSQVIKRPQSYNAHQADSLVAGMAKNGFSFIKLFSLSDEATYYNLCRAAKKYKMPIGGHYPSYKVGDKWEGIKIDSVFSTGYKSLEHLHGYGDEKPEELQRLVALTKKHQTYNCPTIDYDFTAYSLGYPEDYKKRLTYGVLGDKISQKWEANLAKRIEKLGSDAKILEGKVKNQPKYADKINILQQLYKANCLLLVGGDATFDFQLDGFNMYEEMAIWSQAGIDNYTILKSATYNAAKFFDQENIWGSIAVGQEANLILLDKNPMQDIKNVASVNHMMIDKQWLSTQELKTKLMVKMAE